MSSRSSATGSGSSSFDAPDEHSTALSSSAPSLLSDGSSTGERPARASAASRWEEQGGAWSDSGSGDDASASWREGGEKAPSAHGSEDDSWALPSADPLAPVLPLEQPADGALPASLFPVPSNGSTSVREAAAAPVRRWDNPYKALMVTDALASAFTVAFGAYRVVVLPGEHAELRAERVPPAMENDEARDELLFDRFDDAAPVQTLHIRRVPISRVIQGLALLFSFWSLSEAALGFSGMRFDADLICFPGFEGTAADVNLTLVSILVGIPFMLGTVWQLHRMLDGRWRANGYVDWHIFWLRQNRLVTASCIATFVFNIFAVARGHSDAVFVSPFVILIFFPLLDARAMLSRARIFRLLAVAHTVYLLYSLAWTIVQSSPCGGQQSLEYLLTQALVNGVYSSMIASAAPLILAKARDPAVPMVRLSIYPALKGVTVGADEEPDARRYRATYTRGGICKERGTERDLLATPPGSHGSGTPFTLHFHRPTDTGLLFQMARFFVVLYTLLAVIDTFFSALSVSYDSEDICFNADAPSGLWFIVFASAALAGSCMSILIMAQLCVSMGSVRNLLRYHVFWLRQNTSLTMICVLLILLILFGAVTGLGDAFGATPFVVTLYFPAMDLFFTTVTRWRWLYRVLSAVFLFNIVMAHYVGVARNNRCDAVFALSDFIIGNIYSTLYGSLMPSLFPLALRKIRFLELPAMRFPLDASGQFWNTRRDGIRAQRAAEAKLSAEAKL